MKLLLDTHTFLWYCQDAPALSANAKFVLENASHLQLVSVASCWEIAIKAGLRKLTLGEPSESYLINALSSSGFQLLSIELSHATSVEQLPMHHKDPFDRLLIAQALSEHASVVSADAIFDSYGVHRIW